MTSDAIKPNSSERLNNVPIKDNKIKNKAEKNIIFVWYFCAKSQCSCDFKELFDLYPF
jgi:hypothetical protein